MDPEELLTLIKSRRSIRRYKKENISSEIINNLLEAGRWAPSAKNNQPWRFLVIDNSEVKLKLSELTKYKRIVEESNACIAVFFNLTTAFQRDKDMMSIGACIQNILLAAESEGIGAVWLGEILSRKDDVNSLLGIDKENELAAVIALGYPDENPSKGRQELEDLIVKTHT
jgi:nitroreductase